MGFLDGALGGLVGGISSVISTSMSNKAARRNQREAMEWNEKMNLQNQQWEEKMWNMNNEYNSPAQQMQRLQDAGINPNSQFGGMSQNATSQMPQQPVVPQMNGAPVQPYDLNFLGNAVTAMEQANRNKNAQKELELKEAQTRLADAEADKVVEEMLDLTETRPNRQNLLKAQAFKDWNEGDYAYYAGNVMYWNGMYAKDSNRLAIENARADVHKKIVEAMKTSEDVVSAKYMNNVILPLQAKAHNASIKQALSLAIKAREEAKLAAQQRVNAKKQEALLDQQIEGGQSDLDLKKLTNEIYKGQILQYGDKLDNLPFDDLWKIIMHIEQVRGSEGAADFIENYFKLFENFGGAYFDYNIMRQLGEGKYEMPKLEKYGYSPMLGSSPRFHKMPFFESSPSLHNPHDMYIQGY